MKELILYIHGKGGCAGEIEHYKALFPECEVAGLDYQTFTPWETREEIREAVTKLNAEYDSIVLIANSIGAFFSMNAGINTMIRCAYFISPVVDMEKLILNMMSWANVTEKELEEKGVIPLRSVKICPGSTCVMSASILPHGLFRPGSCMAAGIT